MNKEVSYTKKFFADLTYWSKQDRDIAAKILNLVSETIQDPFAGMGKPEPLKYVEENAWSRRITKEHRLVYIVEKDRIVFHQCRYHYEK